jgi:hypothetical protein
MRWYDAIARPTDRKLREFAATAAVVCLALAIWQLASGNAWLGGALLLLALAAMGVAFWRPRWLSPTLTVALVLTFPLAWTVSLAVLAIVFYGLITPLALFFRLTGRDVLDRHPRQDQDSYWRAKPSAEHPRRYLQQY